MGTFDLDYKMIAGGALIAGLVFGGIAAGKLYSHCSELKPKEITPIIEIYEPQKSARIPLDIWLTGVISLAEFGLAGLVSHTEKKKETERNANSPHNI